MSGHCYVPECQEHPEFTFSWRIRGPIVEDGPHDRIKPGYTNSGLKSCSDHVERLAQVCTEMFRE